MTATSTPSIELIQGPTLDQGARGRRRRSQRLRVFLLTFALLFVLGQIGNFMRPAVYRAAVTLLTVEPQGIDQRSAEADVEHVSIQSRLLLGADLLQRMLDAVAAEGFPDLPDLARLETMLEVHSVPDTNLVELRADGKDPALLVAMVDRWADAYVARRAERVAEATDRTTLELRKQQFALEDRIADKELEIRRFAEAYEIVSDERAENRVLARQQGLNDSLNKALEQQAEAKARLNTLLEAARQGRALVPKEESRTLAVMEEQLQRLQAAWAALNEKYTPAYLERDPAYRAIPAEIAELEQKVNGIKTAGKRNILNQATQEYEAATETVDDLRRQLTEHQAQAAAFSARLGRYQDMRDELERLQELLKDNQTRLAAIEIKNRQEFPPMQIVDYAAWPRNPIHPNYWRDAGLIAAVSLLLGLFMAWLVDYLSERNRREEAPLTTTGVRVYAGESKAAIDAPPAADPALEAQPATTALPHNLARELELAELQALLAAAPDDVRAAIGLLLSGMAPSEFDDLSAADYDPAGGRLSLGGDGARDLPLAPAVQRWLQGPDVLGRLDAHSAEEVRAAVTVAAVDAGVVDPATVTPEALRHTFLLYLVRQGARLGELARLVGPVSAVHLQRYGRYSPPGSNRPLAEIETVHPALAF